MKHENSENVSFNFDDLENGRRWTREEGGLDDCDGFSKKKRMEVVPLESSIQTAEVAGEPA